MNCYLEETEVSKYLGLMYVARRPCNKVSAAAWDDGFGSAKERRETLGAWAERGDSVERLDRHEGDPEPDWICGLNDPDCVCRKQTDNA